MEAVRQAVPPDLDGGESKAPLRVTPQAQVQVLAEECFAAEAVHVGVKDLTPCRRWERK